MKTKNVTHRWSKGFTLIELVMTIVVVGIVAVPLSLLLSEHIRSLFQSEDYTMATNLARLDMEKVNNLAYANVATASSPNYNGYNCDIIRTVTYAQGTQLTPESLKQIRVDVRKTGSATVLVSLVTYLARNISYGL